MIFIALNIGKNHLDWFSNDDYDNSDSDGFFGGGGDFGGGGASGDW